MSYSIVKTCRFKKTDSRILQLHTIFVSAIGFFEHVNLIYGTVSEYCTQSTCPDMVGPGPR